MPSTATIIPFTPRTTPRVADYFARLDARLAEYQDAGYAAAFLWQQIDKWNDLAARFNAWALRDDGSPNPLGADACAFEISATVAGLMARSRKMQADAAARVAAYRTAMGAQ